tara:strand:- start:85 stop:1191 length:1107 start_codon:yes stop_codon:yes gene_type:complete
MKKIFIILFSVMIVFSGRAQTNLNLSSVASASASSSGSYGPSNWNDGIINGSSFGWVGTAPNQPTPSYMEFTWTTAQTFDSIRIVNLGTNFSPANGGNGVVFTGSADLEYFNGAQWINIRSFIGQGTYGSAYALTFPSVTGSKFRIINLNTGTNPVNHNPGFDEIEVYLSPPPASIYDAALLTSDTLLDIGNEELHISTKISNVGNQVLDTIDVSYQVSNAPSAITESFFLMLAPGADTTVLLSQSIALDTLPSSLSTEDLCVWVSNTMDVSNSNDTLCLSLKPLNIEAKPLTDVITIYPNPAISPFVVESLSPLNTISIYHINGSLVYRKELNSTFRAEIEHNLPRGLYLVLLKGEAGNSIKRVVLK